MADIPLPQGERVLYRPQIVRSISDSPSGTGNYVNDPDCVFTNRRLIFRNTTDGRMIQILLHDIVSAKVVHFRELFSKRYWVGIYTRSGGPSYNDWGSFIVYCQNDKKRELAEELADQIQNTMLQLGG